MDIAFAGGVPGAPDVHHRIARVVECWVKRKIGDGAQTSVTFTLDGAVLRVTSEGAVSEQAVPPPCVKYCRTRTVTVPLTAPKYVARRARVCFLAPRTGRLRTGRCSTLADTSSNPHPCPPRSLSPLYPPLCAPSPPYNVVNQRNLKAGPPTAIPRAGIGATCER